MTDNDKNERNSEELQNVYYPLSLIVIFYEIDDWPPSVFITTDNVQKCDYIKKNMLWWIKRQLRKAEIQFSLSPFYTYGIRQHLKCNTRLYLLLLFNFVSLRSAQLLFVNISRNNFLLIWRKSKLAPQFRKNIFLLYWVFALSGDQEISLSATCMQVFIC